MQISQDRVAFMAEGFHGHNHQNTDLKDIETNPMMHTMKMFFHFGYGDTFLFKPLVIDTPTKMILCCVILFLMAVLYEGLLYLGSMKCRCQLAAYSRSDVVRRMADKHRLDHHEGTREALVDEKSSDENNVNSGQLATNDGPLSPDSSDITTSGKSNSHTGQPSQSTCSNQPARCCLASAVEIDSANNEGQPALITHCSQAIFQPHHRAFRAVQTLIYTFATVISFVLMLASMTFNLCLLFAIVSGATVGYFIFFPMGGSTREGSVCH